LGILEPAIFYRWQTGLFHYLGLGDFTRDSCRGYDYLQRTLRDRRWLDRIASTDDGDRLIVSRRAYDDIGVYHDIFMVTPEGKLVGRLWLKER
jgi:hypothetical protein